ncbi:ATP synthase F1, delta subunit [Segniliparus rotundus DSM 44985]|uniref:ATP synthase subunit delta n=1 Tax=Segniliparus rotundus (strain ATCC BAA-972 / CDC 1076 / CIP 108378 / DSM 44985 / JCM 13578) TaxID=640132 RepID=D6ZDB5_SEGRD|nr:F0F1 ATP synthase subunit delta [Segniliparus rotundus]ADG97179.1 ATP synthase F1, delta subunit [Segniliparus rotundus DSM 44985]
MIHTTSAVRATSRSAFQSVKQQFDARAAGLSSDELGALFEDLSQTAILFWQNHVLRHAAADPGQGAEAKTGLVDSLLSGKVGAAALDVVRAAVREEWSNGRDLTLALLQLSNLSLLIDAERAGQLEEVEDELFRFGRLLEANAELNGHLSDRVTPVDARTGLLERVISGKTTAVTAKLLRRAVVFHTFDQDHSLDRTVTLLAELAASRRGESVARVVAAVAPTDAQISRLQAVLGKIYGRPISVQIDVDPDVLGGLRVAVGDEVIDGTIAAKLAAAANELPN